MKKRLLSLLFIFVWFGLGSANAEQVNQVNQEKVMLKQNFHNVDIKKVIEAVSK